MEVLKGDYTLNTKHTNNIQAKKQREYFDSQFKNYSIYRLENWRRSYIKRILASLKLQPTDIYLDLGCGGSGYLVIESARRGCCSIGVDISIKGIKKANYFAKSELGEKGCYHFIVANAEQLPIKDCIISKASAIALLEHLENDDLTIEEISRILVNSGYIFTTVPNSFKKMLPLFWLPYYVHDKRIGHLRHYTAEKLKRKFESHGLFTVNEHYSGHLIKIIQYLLNLIYPNFESSKLWWKLENTDLSNNSKSGSNLHMVFKNVRAVKSTLSPKTI